MSFNTIHPQIKTVLDTITSLQEVSETPKLDFNGFPACYVIPSDNTNDYETNVENERVYAFIIRVFYESKNTGVGNAIKYLEPVVDSIVDAFDNEDLKTSATRKVAVGLPNKYTFINIFATPSSWGQLENEGLVFCEIKVRVKISVDIS